MKRLLSLFLLLHVSAAIAVATESGSAVKNWYFDFYDGATVCRLRGEKPGENTETTVIERSVGRYIGDAAFVVDSRVESETGALLFSGTARWQKMGDHFEADIKVGEASYSCVLHIGPSGEAVVVMFMGSTLMSRGEFHVKAGTMYGRINIYDAAGKVATVSNSECKRANQPSEPMAPSGRGSP